MENNLLNAYIEYFRKIAQAHSDIKDFRYLDVAMLQGAISGGDLQTPVLMLDTVKGSFGDVNWDTPIPYLEGGFMVLYAVSPDNYDEELAALDKSHRIGLEILQRMESDMESTSPFFTGFNRKNVKWEALGPVTDNLFGILFSFKLCVMEIEARPPEEIWNDYGS